MAAPSSVDASGAVTEDEAALYDRQIRLWGLSAQTKMRKAHVLIVGWDGIATEIIKNVVLSGIGSITVLDPIPVHAARDLISGFFFRDDDVGKSKCSQAPLDRVRALNPLVKVHGVSDQAAYDVLLQGKTEAEAWLRENGIDVLIAAIPLPPLTVSATTATKGLKEQLITLNNLTRKVGIKFFMSATYGFGGLIFADQIMHEYLIEKAAPPSSSSTTSSTPAEKIQTKLRQTFVPLSTSLAHTWAELSRAQERRMRMPLDFFVWLAYIDLSSHLGSDTADATISSSALKERTLAVIKDKGMNVEMVLRRAGGADEADRVFESFTSTGGQCVVLAPVGSVLGGILSQDILNSIGGREEPIVNWMFLYSDASGAATIHRIGDLQDALVVE